MVSLVNGIFLQRQSHRKIVQKWLPRAGGRGNREGLVKEHKLSAKGQILSEDIM